MPDLKRTINFILSAKHAKLPPTTVENDKDNCCWGCGEPGVTEFQDCFAGCAFKTSDGSLEGYGGVVLLCCNSDWC